MSTKISEKIAKLKSASFDLGNQRSNEVNISSGGTMQEFEIASIYWHPIMVNEAHEVHGAVLTKYLSIGGHDKDPVSGQRLVGYPITDVEYSDDSMCRKSRFEWGSIYTSSGGVVVYGKIHEEYIKSDAEKGSFGYPLADTIKINDGLVVFFEHGCMYTGTRSQEQVIKIFYKFPKMGNPWMCKSSAVALKHSISLSCNKTLMTVSSAEKLLQDIFNTRLFLIETAINSNVALSINVLDTTTNISTPNAITFRSAFIIQGVTALKNKQLYDILLKLPNKTHSISPHSIYIDESWANFKFIHATDLHISRRLDHFRKFFSDKSMDDAARNFNNFNDNFREFIKYANSLHQSGQLDFILITGDLVDYIFEEGNKTYINNNFVYFENIVRGLTGKQDQIENDELKVPIFTSLGNHDYRTRPYYPLFTIDIQWPFDNRTIEQFGPLNITRDEAKIVSEELLHINEMISSDTAANMTKPDKDNADGNLDYYFTHICREKSYVVTLDEHQVIMINGKWDDGVIEDTGDAITYYLGFKGEAADNFVGGSPDSVGFETSELDMVSNALKKTGLVIIGVHNPIINPKNSEYAYFMREYIRSSNPPFINEVRKYLFRQDPMSFEVTPSQAYFNLTKNVHNGWSREGLSVFFEGKLDDLLDYGVMRGNREEFLKICSGVKTNGRAVDLILSGHVHKNWECRIVGDSNSLNFKVAHEFYTESPATYYHSYDTDIKADGPIAVTGFGNKDGAAKIVSDRMIRIHVNVTDDAKIDEKPIKGTSGVWSIKVKPSPITLNAQKNSTLRKMWWQMRKPLLLQTAALGPSEFLRAPERQPDFRGCRLISVVDNTMETIQYITHAAIKHETINITHVVVTGPDTQHA